jgi:hypothetical protein
VLANDLFDVCAMLSDVTYASYQVDEHGWPHQSTAGTVDLDEGSKEVSFFIDFAAILFHYLYKRAYN